MEFWVCPNCGNDNEQININVGEVVCCDSCFNLSIVTDYVEGILLEVEEF